MNSHEFTREFLRLCFEVADSYNDKTARRGNRLRMMIDQKLVPAACKDGVDVDKELMALLAHEHAYVRFHAGAVLLRSKSETAIQAGEETLQALVGKSHPEAWDVGFLSIMQLDLLKKMRRGDASS